jgi:hypothetical protein
MTVGWNGSHGRKNRVGFHFCHRPLREPVKGTMIRLILKDMLAFLFWVAQAQPVPSRHSPHRGVFGF